MKLLRFLVLSFFKASPVLVILLTGLGTFPPAFAVVLASPEAQTFRLAPSGSDTASCGSASAPCRTIQYTVNKAASGDSLLLAAGTYTYNASADTCTFLPSSGKSVVCIVDKSLTILGGYTTSNWSTPDPVNNPTVIDGGSTYRGCTCWAITARPPTCAWKALPSAMVRRPVPTQREIPPVLAVAWSYLALHHTTRHALPIQHGLRAEYQQRSRRLRRGAGLAINWSQAGTSSLLERVTFDSNQSFGGTGPVRGGLAFGAFYMNGSVTVRDSSFTNNTARAGNSTGNGSSGGLLADALGGAIGGSGGTWLLETYRQRSNLVQGGNAATYAGGGYGGAIIIENASNFTLRDLTSQTILLRAAAQLRAALEQAGSPGKQHPGDYRAGRDHQ